MPVETQTRPVNTASPWGRPAVSAPAPSLTDVMSEQLVQQLVNPKPAKELEDEGEVQQLDTRFLDQRSVEEQDADFALALQLQIEEDNLQNARLTIQEREQNRNAGGVTVSLQNLKVGQAAYVDHGAYNYDEADLKQEEDHYFASGEVNDPVVSKNPNAAPGTVSKQDPGLAALRNGRKLDAFPISFNSGYIAKDQRLPGRAYTALHEKARQMEAQRSRIHGKEERSTVEQAIDPRTRLMLHKIVNSEQLSAIHGCVSIGKEAAIYFAEGGDEMEGGNPGNCAVKIFKTTLSGFQNREQYIKDDFRFRMKFNKQNPRKVVRMWAEKEMHNLQRIFHQRIPCPEPLLLREHILVMKFLGTADGVPAPKLRDAVLRFSVEKCARIYEQVVALMKRLFDECQLVHADLSEYNMLYHDGQVFLIDVSQAVDRMHPQAMAFLYRDCCNVTKFFQKCGVSSLHTISELFRTVTSNELDHQLVLKIKEQLEQLDRAAEDVGGRAFDVDTDQNGCEVEGESDEDEEEEEEEEEENDDDYEDVDSDEDVEVCEDVQRNATAEAAFLLDHAPKNWHLGEITSKKNPAYAPHDQLLHEMP